MNQSFGNVDLIWRYRQTDKNGIMHTVFYLMIVYTMIQVGREEMQASRYVGLCKSLLFPSRA